MTRAARAEIDLRALQHNLRRVRANAPRSRVMAIIKANGYGHGLVRVAQALGDVEAFGVASLDEAIELREAGISHPIVLLEGFFDNSELSPIARYGLEPVLHHPEQLAMLETARLSGSLSLWIKLDTGMHRLGFPPGAAGEALARVRGSGNAAGPVRWMTHLACADDRADGMTAHQTSAFNEALAGIEGERSIANSAGVLGWPQTHADWVRPGIMLYGVSPFVDDTASDHDLLPAMTLRSRLIAVNRFRRGDTVGYGASWTCPEDMPVGVVAIGYGDGYPRHAQPGTPVLVGGSRVPLIGRVSMDMVTVDLRGCPGAGIGDEVVLWGEGLPVEEIAGHASTIAYELLCGVAQRVRQVETAVETPGQLRDSG